MSRLRILIASLAWGAATAWAIQAVLERFRPTHVADPERPELRLRARLTPSEHAAILAAQGPTIQLLNEQRAAEG